MNDYKTSPLDNLSKKDSKNDSNKLNRVHYKKFYSARYAPPHN